MSQLFGSFIGLGTGCVLCGSLNLVLCRRRSNGLLFIDNLKINLGTFGIGAAICFVVAGFVAVMA